MAEEKKDEKKKVKDHIARRKTYKHLLGDAKRDEAVKSLPKRKRRRVASAKARKALRAKPAKPVKAAAAPATPPAS